VAIPESAQAGSDPHVVPNCQSQNPTWAGLLLRAGQNLNLGMLPHRIAGPPQVRHTMPSVSLLNWGDASKGCSGPQPLAALEATNAPGKEEEFCFETPVPTLSWPSSQHLVNGSTMARRSSDMEACALAATIDAEMSTQDEGEMSTEHAHYEPGALEEPRPAPAPSLPPPEDPKDPLTAAQKPDLLVSAGQPEEEPCDEEMQNSQNDARLDAILHPCNDMSTATERTANGGDFRLQLPPKHPLANVHFASKGLQHANPGSPTRSRRYQFGVQSTLVTNSTLHSPYDTVAALAGATAHDPSLLVANSKNNPASLTSLDLNMGYCHIRLDPAFKQLCAIVLPFGKYECQAIPMGLCISPDIFQEKMSEPMDGLAFVQTCIDDLQCPTKGSFSDHLEKVELVLQRLQKAGLEVNVAKSFFARSQLEYLGCWITRIGIKAVNDKVKAVLTIAEPKTQNELRSFIGVINYYRGMWVRRSHVLAPSAALTPKTTKWKCEPQHQKAFAMARRVC